MSKRRLVLQSVRSDPYVVIVSGGGTERLDHLADLLLLGEPDWRRLRICLCEIGDNVVLLIVDTDESNCELVDGRGDQLQSVVCLRKRFFELSNVLF